MCKKCMDWLPLKCPQQATWPPQTRHVPWLGIEPVTFWFTGWRSIHWATPARAPFGFLIKTNFYFHSCTYHHTQDRIEQTSRKPWISQNTSENSNMCCTRGNSNNVTDCFHRLHSHIHVYYINSHTGMREATTDCFSPGLSPTFPLSLKIKSKNLKKKIAIQSSGHCPQLPTKSITPLKCNWEGREISRRTFFKPLLQSLH